MWEVTIFNYAGPLNSGTLFLVSFLYLSVLQHIRIIVSNVNIWSCPQEMKCSVPTFACKCDLHGILLTVHEFGQIPKLRLFGTMFLNYWVLKDTGPPALGHFVGHMSGNH